MKKNNNTAPDGELMALVMAKTEKIRKFVETQLRAGQLQYQLEKLERDFNKERNKLLYSDPLTEMGNRRYLWRMLYKEITGIDKDERQLAANGQQKSPAQKKEDRENADEEKGNPNFSLLLVNLNRLRVMNETLGYDAGDDLLIETARRLEECLPNVDSREICRISGDSFAILLRNARNQDDAIEVARRLLSALVVPIKVDDKELHVTTSIGIAMYPDDGIDSNGLIINAEAAMWEAREDGERTYHTYLPEMKIGGMDRLTLENNLRQALVKKEFTLHYQPQISLKDNKIVAVEAFLRWENPDLGTVSPAQFIPLLQETGLIVEVGEWVIHEACSQCKKWWSLAPELKVAVNISGRQLNHRDFSSLVKRAVYAAEIKPDNLILDLQESSVLRDPEKSFETLRELRNIGITLAIDDFGVGQTSFHQLKQMPANAMKIDPSFLRNINEEPENKTVINAIVAMAHELKMEVVAEGVEQAEQMEYLQEIGCDFMQGYYFCRPLPAEQIEVVLRDEGRDMKSGKLDNSVPKPVAQKKPEDDESASEQPAASDKEVESKSMEAPQEQEAHEDKNASPEEFSQIETEEKEASQTPPEIEVVQSETPPPSATVKEEQPAPVPEPILESAPVEQASVEQVASATVTPLHQDEAVQDDGVPSRGRSQQAQEAEDKGIEKAQWPPPKEGY